jgi:hypothetical protein
MATEKRITRLIRADVTVDAFTKWLTSTYDGRMPADIVNEIPTVDAVEIDVLEDWLYEIANNNFGNALCRSCCEIVNRLDGLRVFARERKDNG